MNNTTTRRSVSSLRGWTQSDARAWMDAHRAELPKTPHDLNNREIGSIKWAGAGAGQYDPSLQNLTPERGWVKTATGRRISTKTRTDGSADAAGLIIHADSIIDNNSESGGLPNVFGVIFDDDGDTRCLPSYRAQRVIDADGCELVGDWVPAAYSHTQLAHRAGRERNYLSSSIEPIRHYIPLNPTTTTITPGGDLDARRTANNEMKNHGGLRPITITLGQPLPRHMRWDCSRGVYSCGERNNKTFTSLTAEHDVAGATTELDDTFDWAAKNTTPAEYRAIRAFLNRDNYTRGSYISGINKLTAAAAERDAVRRTITGRFYCWTTV